MEAIIAWLAPMASAIIVAGATALINQRMKMAERKADERHAEAEAERKRRDSWRGPWTCQRGTSKRETGGTT